MEHTDIDHYNRRPRSFIIFVLQLLNSQVALKGFDRLLVKRAQLLSKGETVT